MPNPQTTTKRWRVGFALAACLLAAACFKMGPRPQCDELPFKAISGQSITAIDIYDGNSDRRSPKPRVTLRDPAQIAALQSFLIARTDDWFIPAGETHDPYTRKANSVITAVFRNGNVAVAQVGYSPAFLETPGCGFEAIFILTREDDETIRGLLGDALPPASSGP